MDAIKIAVAERCLNGAKTGAMDFPAIVGLLAAEGFDGYLVDYRAGTVVYYGADGEAAALHAGDRYPATPVAFDDAAISAAIGEAQRKVPGYSYAGFSDKVTRTGCAGYLVSLSGRRVVYFGRSGKTHVEHMPG